MSALRRFCATLLAGLLLASWPAVSRADTIRLEYDDTGADPAETFDEDCLGDAPAEDCDTRATLIEGELAVLLSRLESDESPETLALFQAALELESPLVQAMAVRYLSRAAQQPADFFSKVKTFFLGPDAPLATASSAALQTSSDETDQKLVELFDEQRPASAYDWEPPTDSDDFSENGLVNACIRDARLELSRSFSEGDQFAPADRLLAYDRFVRPIFDFTQDYPVSTFATDASLDDVAAFFTMRFGKPLGPVAGSAQRQAELSLELSQLSQAAAGGDQQAIKRIQELSGELEGLQQSTSLDQLFYLSALHADNDLVWLDGDVNDAYTQPVRAVTAGEDPLLGKTVIRYFNATADQPSASGGRGSGDGGGSGNGNGNGDGDGTAGSSAAPSGESGAVGAAGNDRGGSGSDSGCGCALPGSPQHGSTLSVISLLLVGGFLRWRRRRN